MNETRMLLLGGQVLLGFSYRICFEHAFDRIPDSARIAQLAALGIMTAGLGWLIWPAAFHQLVEGGAETETLHRFTTRILDLALLPFAVGLGLSLYPVASALRLPHPAWMGIAAGGFAMLAWYGGIAGRGGSKQARPRQESGEEQAGPARTREPDLSRRIKMVLIECRMALPGAQAFLGFQLAIVFAQGFDQLPRSSQLIHFGSLLATTIAIVLLIAPAAYHRVAEQGNDTERFHRVAARFLLVALVFLAPGMAGDALVVTRRVTGNSALATAVSLVLLLTFYGLWFGVGAWHRRR